MHQIQVQQIIDCIELYHDLLSHSDQESLIEIAKRALRKAVSVGRAELTPQSIRDTAKLDEAA